jgi:hypothetical protein
MIDKEKIYLRTLELQSVVSEEWGEAIKEINDYNWKAEKCNNDTLKDAIQEINQMYSPLFELQALLETMMKLNEIEEK